MSEQLPIRKLVERITSGDIRIPAFQRDFVWEPEQVAFLLDSIYKGFPIRTVILWRTDKRLNTEKKLGQFALPEPKKDYPVNYVLDGQQRITSLFSVFQSELKPENDSWTNIYFDLLAQETLQESLFVALEQTEVDLTRHFPVSTLFEPSEYRKATEVFKNDGTMLDRLDALQAKFKEYFIPNIVFESDDRSKVAIVFERINRAGTDLSVFELLAAWSWSEEFDLVDEFADLEEDIAEHGFEELGSDRDLQLRICAAVISGETTPSKVLDLKGAEIREKFPSIRAGILGALDFLKREAKVLHFKMLPFSAALVPLSVFFATELKDGKNYTEKQKQHLLRWFWRSTFSKRYSADVNSRQAADIVEMLALSKDENHDFKHQKQELHVDFVKETFSTGSTSGRAHVLLLTSLQPHSFLSGATIDPAKVLKKGSKHEFHHVFPRKYLELQGVDSKKINSIANICFLTRSDNNQIKASEPSKYVAQMDGSRRSDYLSEALCPTNISALSFDEFLSKRNELLVAQVMALTK